MDLINFFNQTLNYNWDMDPIDRTLDPQKAKEYLAKFTDPDEYKLIKTMLEKLEYWCFEDFKKALFLSFEKFKNNIGHKPFYILLDESKIGSEWWLVALLWSKIKELNFQDFITRKSSSLPDNSNIVLIDDAIYSGHHLLSLIDEYTFNNKINGDKYNWHIMTPIVNKEGIRGMLDCFRINYIWHSVYVTKT